MPVYKMLNEMPYEELISWFYYFSIRPIGWEDDQRTYMLLQAQGVKEKAERLFPSLATIKRARYENDNSNVASSLISSGLFDRLQGAAKTNKINWEVKIDKN